MNFLYCHIFCVCILPTQGDISFAFLRSPESTPDKLNVRIDGSIDLGTNWNYSDVVRESINEIGQSLRQYNRDMVQNEREVQWNKEKSDNRQQNKWDKRDTTEQGRQGFWASSGLNQQYKDGNSDKRDTTRETMSDNSDTVQRDKEYAWYKADKKDNAQWDDSDTSDNDNVQRQGGKKTETWNNRDIVPQHKRQKEGIVGVTQFGAKKTTDHKVKDVERTKEFSVHIFKQTMQVFDSIKRKMGDSDMKAKVDDMARSYKDQFGDFVRKQRETSVRTKMGDQRAILHTMDTSNLILQRLVNFLKADMEKTDIERSSDNTLQREVDAARELEYKHVCSKYGYCRSDKGFTVMLQNCIKTLMSADDEKIYQARDALTEVLKTGDYRKLIDSKTDKSFKKKIKRLEKKEPQDLREALRVLLGMLSNAQTPLTVDGENTEVVKKTAAFYTLLAMWEDVMPGDEANKLEWADIENSLGDWSRGKRTDVYDIIKALDRNMKRGLKKIDPDTEVKMKEQVMIIRG